MTFLSNPMTSLRRLIKVDVVTYDTQQLTNVNVEAV